MPRDYRHRPAASKGKGKGKGVSTRSCGWVGFLTGLMMGVFLSGFAYLTLQDKGVIETPKTAASGGKKGAEKKGDSEKKDKPAPPAVPGPRYDFYTVLPETEVVVADEPAAPASTPAGAASGTPTATATATATATDGAKPDRYLVQVSSYRTVQDADRLKAKLTLLGFTVDIQKVDLGDKGTVFRVNSGPHTKEEAQRVRTRLEKQSIGGLMIRAK